MTSQQGHSISLNELSVWPNPSLMKLPALLLLLFLFTLYKTLPYVCHRTPVSISWLSVRFLCGFLKGADALSAGFMHLSFTVVHVPEAPELTWSLKVFIYPLQELIWKQYLSLGGGIRSLSSLWKSAGSHSRCHQTVSSFSTKGWP